ncbi:MAG: glucosyltransferase domain-containing protein [Agathobacter sp.]
MKINKTNLYEKAKIVFIAFCILFVAYSNFINFFYTSDHVSASFSPDFPERPASFRAYLASGMMTSFFYSRISYILGKVGITVFHHRNFYLGVILLALAISYAILYRVFEGYVQKESNKFWFGAALMVSFINPYIIEIFVYLGWEHALGILLTVLAVWFFTKNKYIFSAIFLMLGIGSYRSFFTIFLIYTTTWLFLEHEKCEKKIFWKKNFLAVGMTGLCALATIVLTNISTRKIQAVTQSVESVEVYEHKTVTAETFNEVTLFYRLKKLFWKYYYTTVTEMGLLPKYFLLIGMLLIGAVVLVILIKNKEKIGKKFLFIIWFALINVCPVSIYFLTPQYDVFARIVWPIFAGFASLLLLPLCLDKLEGAWNAIYKGILVLIGFVIVYSTSTAKTNFFISNSLDVQVVMQVQSAIEHYEDETGVKVTTIAAKRYERSQESYPQIDSGYYNYTHKSMYDAWCDVELMNYILKTDYKEISMDEEQYSKLFGEKVWTTFNADEQLVFDGEILYWAVY